MAFRPVETRSRSAWTRTRLPSRSGAARPTINTIPAQSRCRCREQHCLRHIGRPESGDQGSRHHRDGRNRSDHQLTRTAEDRVRDEGKWNGVQPEFHRDALRWPRTRGPGGWPVLPPRTRPADRDATVDGRTLGASRSRAPDGGSGRGAPQSSACRLLADRSGSATQSATLPTLTLDVSLWCRGPRWHGPKRPASAGQTTGSEPARRLIERPGRGADPRHRARGGAGLRMPASSQRATQQRGS